MQYLIGMLLAVATGAMGSLVGFDRSRAFYPVILIVIGSYYCLFAVMAGSERALWSDAIVASIFTAAAITGFRTSLWLVVAALAAHGAMDAVHHHLITNAGVLKWWPGFCAMFDVTAAAYLALSLWLRGEPTSSSALYMGH
jgi:hypothetical protein